MMDEEKKARVEQDLKKAEECLGSVQTALISSEIITDEGKKAISELTKSTKNILGDIQKEIQNGAKKEWVKEKLDLASKECKNLIECLENEIVKRAKNILKESLKAAIYGLAVADALGVPYEFQERGSFTCTDMTGYGTHNQPEGTWSDDTSMTLATCRSIQKHDGKVIPEDIRREFEQWLFQKEYTPFGEVFDCGNTCYEAICDKQGKTDEWSNGNGSLMRILPLAFVPGISDEMIEEVSAITHGHAIAKEACVIYVKIAKSLIQKKTVKEAILENVPETSFFAGLRNIENVTEDGIQSGGYVADTLHAALWCLMKTDSYKDCVLKAVNLGSDTDTTAAVAGGLAGIVYGYDGIPGGWIEKLQRKDIIDGVLW